MHFKPPFAGLERRAAWLRATLLLACFLGLVASWPAWLNTRSFPLVPIVAWFPILPSPTDKILFGLMLVSLGMALWFYRSAVISFLVLSFLEFCQDQNRGQPWLYMYWVMLLLSLARPPMALAACRIALCVVYAWSGIQKLNPRFFQIIPGWFVAPATHWHLPPAFIDLLKLAVGSAPFLELAVAFLLWIPRLRRLAFGLVIMLHGAALLFLMGYNYNWVVWPWNLAMIALVWGLFSTSKFFLEGEVPPPASIPIPERKGKSSHARGGRKKSRVAASLPDVISLRQIIRQVRASKPVLIGLLLYSLLPCLSYIGWWDSYFSFSLYAENAAHANLFVTQAFADRLPSELRKYVKPFPQAYDPQHQAPLMLAFDPWCYEELRVPPIPEVRNFRAIYQHLRIYAPRADDLRLIIGPRSGPVMFFQGDELELLRPK